MATFSRSWAAVGGVIGLLAVLAAPTTALAQCPGVPTGFTVTRGLCRRDIQFTLNGPTTSVEIRRSPANDTSGVFAAASLVGTVTTALSDSGFRTFTDTTVDAGSSYTYWLVARGSNLFCGQLFTSEPLVSPGITAASVNLRVVFAQCNQTFVAWNLPPEVPPQGFGSQGVLTLIRVNVDDPSDSQEITRTTGATVGFFDTTGVPGRRYQYTLGIAQPCGLLAFQTALPVTAVGPGRVATPVDFVSVQTGSPGPGQPRAAAVLNPGITPGFPVGTWSWTRDGQPVLDEGPSGRVSIDPTTGVLTILDARLADAGAYQAQLLSSCGTLRSRVGLVLTRRLVSDVNDSGEATVQDVFDFLAGFFAGV